MCGVLVGTLVLKPDWGPPPRLNSLDGFMVAKATRKYGSRGVMALGRGGGVRRQHTPGLVKLDRTCRGRKVIGREAADG